MQEWDKTPEQIQAIMHGDEWEWSYSRVKLSDCLYGWYLQYVSGIPKEELDENAYAQFGTLVHKTLEKFLKGELTIFDVVDFYEQQYPEIVVCNFPHNAYTDLGEKSYNDGLLYFQNLMFDFDRYEVLGVEKEYHFKVGDYPFVGYVDAIYRDKETNEIIIRDHKTTSFKWNKNGQLSKPDRTTLEAYKKQEYLYCIPVLEEYGRVDYLSWNMIRNRQEIKIPFNKEEFEATKQWAIDSIHTLENEMLWLPNDTKSYFCSNLCSVRSKCPYRHYGGE